MAERNSTIGFALQVLLVASMVFSPIARYLSFADCRCVACPTQADCTNCTVADDQLEASGCCSQNPQVHKNPSLPSQSHCCCAVEDNAHKSPPNDNEKHESNPLVSHDDRCSCGCLEGIPPSDLEPISAQLLTKALVLADVSTQVSIRYTPRNFSIRTVRSFGVSDHPLSTNERCARFCRWLI